MLNQVQHDCLKKSQIKFQTISLSLFVTECKDLKKKWAIQKIQET